MDDVVIQGFGAGFDAFVSGFTSGLDTQAGIMLGAMADIVPIAVEVLGGYLVVLVGVSVFRRVVFGPAPAEGDYTYWEGDSFDRGEYLPYEGGGYDVAWW